MSSDNSPRPRLLPSAKVAITVANSRPFTSWLRPSRWSLFQYDDWRNDTGSAPIALLPDDYLQVALARTYGPVSAWGALAEDPLYRSRATSLVLTYWTETIFGFSRLAFGLSSILLHAVNALLVYALGAARRIGWRLSALTAIFFVLQERYQEAVIWY